MSYKNIYDCIRECVFNDDTFMFPADCCLVGVQSQSFMIQIVSYRAIFDIARTEVV